MGLKTIVKLSWIFYKLFQIFTIFMCIESFLESYKYICVCFHHIDYIKL